MYYRYKRNWYCLHTVHAIVKIIYLTVLLVNLCFFFFIRGEFIFFNRRIKGETFVYNVVRGAQMILKILYEWYNTKCTITDTITGTITVIEKQFGKILIEWNKK